MVSFSSPPLPLSSSPSVIYLVSQSPSSSTSSFSPPSRLTFLFISTSPSLHIRHSPLNCPLLPADVTFLPSTWPSYRPLASLWTKVLFFFSLHFFHLHLQCLPACLWRYWFTQPVAVLIFFFIVLIWQLSATRRQSTLYCTAKSANVLQYRCHHCNYHMVPLSTN